MSSNSEIPITNEPNKYSRLRLPVILFTLFGIALFVYFIHSVGFSVIIQGIARIGLDGFVLILFLYFLRILVRAAAWKLSVYEPYSLPLRDAVSAVIIGEALSSIIPLGILVSGTAKAVAVRKKMPLVAGLSSVATENLFYSLGTGFLIVLGAAAFLRTFDLPEVWTVILNLLIASVFSLILFGIFVIVRQWHFVSAICEKLYEKGFFIKYLEGGRIHVKLFENLIYGFYRRYPKRFMPIFLCQIAFHTLGVVEVWFVLSRISRVIPSFYTAFLLESISRIIIVFFKLVPFLIGVDEAGAKFVTDTLALGAGVGVTMAIIRKGRILFWALIGVALILRRGLSVKEIFQESEFAEKINEENKKVVSTQNLG